MTTHEYIDDFKKHTGRVPSQVELSKNLKLSHTAALQALIQYMRLDTKEKKVAEVKKQKQGTTVLFLRGFLIFISAMAFTLSVYFTGLWFTGRFHIVISGLISLSMVTFMVISPQTWRFIKNPMVKVIVALSFTIALLFSMGSTIAGQYQKTSERIEAEPDKAYQFNQLLTSEEEVEQLVKDAQKDKAIHQKTIEFLSASSEDRLSNYQEIATERKYIAEFDSRIDGLREELKSVRTDKIDNGIIEEKRDFYLFISGLTGWEKSFTEFLISSLPAIFIDVISALCLNLALFIKKEDI